MKISFIMCIHKRQIERSRPMDIQCLWVTPYFAVMVLLSSQYAWRMLSLAFAVSNANRCDIYSYIQNLSLQQVIDVATSKCLI